MAELEGLTQKKIAADLGISLSGAKSRVQRARGKLKEMILDCCHVEADKYGNILDYQPKGKAGSGCNCDTNSSEE